MQSVRDKIDIVLFLLSLYALRYVHAKSRTLNPLKQEFDSKVFGVTVYTMPCIANTMTAQHAQKH